MRVGARRTATPRNPFESIPVIDAEHLIKSYELGGQVVHALDDVTFRVAAGEMVAIRGPAARARAR